MKQYEKACTMFEAAGITYEEINVEGFSITFRLVRGSFAANVVIDFAAEQVEKKVEVAIASFLNCVDWDIKEQQRQQRRKNRKEKKK